MFTLRAPIFLAKQTTIWVEFCRAAIACCNCIVTIPANNAIIVNASVEMKESGIIIEVIHMAAGDMRVYRVDREVRG